MKNPDKIIEVDELGFDKSKAVQVPLNSLFKFETEIYKYKEELFTKFKGTWYFSESSKLETTKDLDTTQIKEIFEWCIKFKEYVDKDIGKIREDIESLYSFYKEQQEKINILEENVKDSINKQEPKKYLQKPLKKQIQSREETLEKIEENKTNGE